MKILFVLFLLAATVWLGTEYYQNGKLIEKQQARIAQLEKQLAQIKQQAAVPAQPQFRLSGNGSSGRSTPKQPERRFKRK